ncbi:MAG: DinB family protein [Cyclobacteriaceae bacterium]|nr:DinB family protein [Cyclobacteriaceae bacterium]
MANKQVQELVKQFETMFQGSPWYGSSIEEILEEIDEKVAFWTPTPKAHSIAQLVWHMVYWCQSLIKRLEGDLTYKGSMKSEDNWSTESKLKALGWSTILKLLHESQNRLLELLTKQPDSLLDKIYIEKATHRDLIQGILQHDLYHAGQIAYLKSICTLK